MNGVLVIDYGSQVTQLIARRVRAARVRCDIVPCGRIREGIERRQPLAVILSGGPASVTDAESRRHIAELQPVLALKRPVLGICYGQQLICAALGGRVQRARVREFGRAQLQVVEGDSLFHGIAPPKKSLDVWMSHGDRVDALPPGFRVLGTSEHAPFAAIGDARRALYGVQFHPEVVHTRDGARLLQNFAQRIADCPATWTMRRVAAQLIEQLQAQIGDREVLCGLSGGVDSSVAAVLLHRAVGQQLTCIYVDSGLMRANESAEVVGLFRQHYPMRLLHCRAQARFLRALKGVAAPERKRKRIGKLFVDLFQEEAKKRPRATFLAQGTLYPDVIESTSVGGPSRLIKSHHNVGGLPARMRLKLVEPLRALFKDEVRALGRSLGMPPPFLRRHPFPGPGLAVRLPGEVTPKKLAILRAADAVYLDAIRRAGLYDKIWQAFAVLLPVRSVGVMGDARSYEHVCALRAVTSTDGMTADFYPFSARFLGAVATRIINEVPGINRVVYDVSSKPPATIEWE